MCGINGFINFKKNLSSPEGSLRKMTDKLYHRGPDDSGIWFDPVTAVGLGHRRLSILDLSSDGHQPMLSKSGRYVLVYNGEIYNYKSLSHRKFNGDTASLLNSIDEVGLEKTLQKINGMFAFALWDKASRKLFLVRDRLGIKPLYYGWHKENFLFASELKAIRAYPDYQLEINRQALALQMQYLAVPAPYSIDLGINKLMPGEYLVLDYASKKVKTYKYWDLQKIAEHGLQTQPKLSDGEFKAALHEQLSRSIKYRMISDVPIGAFLSGGIDSSMVASLMQAQSSKPIKTFSIGFNDGKHNEAKFAKDVARHLGTDHTEFYVDESNAIDVIPKLPSLYDEPFADASQIPTFLVSQLAKKSVTVSLSGDGGDELFAGYNRHVFGPKILTKTSFMPSSLRRLAGSLLSSISADSWDKVSRVLKVDRKIKLLGEKAHKLAKVLSATDINSLYSQVTACWEPGSNIVLGVGEWIPRSSRGMTGNIGHGTAGDIGWGMSGSASYGMMGDSREMSSRGLTAGSITAQMQYLDMINYLPNDILTKVDRASMGVGLEARVPLLDHNLVEFAWRCPLSLKIRDGKSKWLLRQVLYDYVPEKLIDRPKQGFSVPIENWMRKDLKDWAYDLISPEKIKSEGFFDEKIISKVWQEFQSGKGAWHHHLWNVLMFQAWFSSGLQGD